MPKYLGDVRCWVNSGKHLLALSFSGFDPFRKSAPPEDISFDLARDVFQALSVDRYTAAS